MEGLIPTSNQTQFKHDQANNFLLTPPYQKETSSQRTPQSISSLTYHQSSRNSHGSVNLKSRLLHNKLGQQRRFIEAKVEPVADGHPAESRFTI